MKIQYCDILFMPVKRFYDIIKWKSDLEEERQKMMKEQEASIIAAQKQKRR